MSQNNNKSKNNTTRLMQSINKTSKTIYKNQTIPKNKTKTTTYGFLFFSIIVIVLEIVTIFNHKLNTSLGYMSIISGIFILTIVTISRVTNINKDLGFVISATLSMIFTMIPLVILTMAKTKTEKINSTQTIENNKTNESNNKNENHSNSTLLMIHSLILTETILFILFLNYIFKTHESYSIVLKYPKYNFVVLIALFLFGTVNTVLTINYTSSHSLYETDG